MHTLLQDLRYGARMLLKKPGFTFIAVITLSLGIGANTAIFSVANAVLLRPLPYQQPEQLVVLHEKRAEQGRLRGLISPPDFLDWQEQNQVFAQMAAYTGAFYNLAGDGEPERLWGLNTTPELFATLGVQPMLGRDFTPEDGAPNAPGGVILSHGLWQRRFSAMSAIIGKTIRLDDGNYTIIGVMPPHFQFPDKKTELWRSFNLSAVPRTSRSYYFLTGIGRLKPGITLARAQAEMEAVAARLEQRFPTTNKGHSVSLFGLNEETVGRLRPALLVLLGAVALVLLIACANVASLSLARAAGRQREMAVRASLGATRMALVRQLLTESLLLAVGGGALGLLLAVGGVDLLIAVGPGNLPRLDQVGVDSRVLVFTLTVSAWTGIVCGLLPALQLSKSDLSSRLKESGQSTVGSVSRRRTRNALVVAEVALALLLLVGAGLLIRSFVRLLEVEPGFATGKIVAIDLSLNGERFNHRRHIFMEQLTARVAALPGIEAVGATTHLPLSGEDGSRPFTVVGDTVRSEGEKLVAEYRAVTPDYMRAMKIPLRAGRYFSVHDRNEYFTTDGRRIEGYANRERGERDAPGVAIVNEALARRSFPGASPLGQRIVIGDGLMREHEIVGVVGDVKHFGLDEAVKPEIYLPYAQRPWQNQTLVIRSAVPPTGLTAAVRGEVRALDKDLPLYGIRTMEDYLNESVATRRLSMLLLAVFAGLALLLAGIGIYGVISHSVSERTREIGLRLALGAQRRDVLKLVVGQGMKLAVGGVAIGLVASFAVTRLMTKLLFGISVTDPLTYALIVLLLAGVAFAACYLPARRATKVDPMIALRYE